jgi:PAS domain S-box-containing protein
LSPSARFPRLALAAAVLVVLLLVVDLETVHSTSRSLFFSNLLDLVMVLFAALCSFYVARRSSGYACQLWTLLALALSLGTIAQAISTYYQSFVPGSAEIPWPSDLLFFLWVAPVFMMFLPPSDDKSPGIDWLRILDFVQVAIVAATAYLYFFNIPSRWQSHHTTLLRQILILYIIRDGLLSTGFFLRARTALSPWLRHFSISMAVIFLAAVLSHGDYLLTLGSYSGAATWGDLLWTVPYLLIVIVASTWKRATHTPVHEPHSRFADFVLTHILPIGIPLLVIFMGRRIAREQLLIAWLAMAASFLCSALRLILTNRKQQRISKELQSTALALRRSEHMFTSAFRWSPDSFSINVYPSGPYLEVNEGFTRLTGYSREETLNKTPSEMNLWLDPSQRARMLSQLNETGEVREQEFLYRTKSGQIRTGQMSAAVTDLDGRPCALVVVRDVTARIEAENLLRSNEEHFRSLVENLHVGIVLCDPVGRILFANQAASDIFGIPAQMAVGKTAVDLDLVPLNEDGSRLPNDSRPVALVTATRQPLCGQMMGWRVPNSQRIVWTLLDAFPEFGADGSLRRVILSFTNLTEHRRALEALRESEERFRTLVRDLHVGVVLHGPDSRIQFANHAALRMFGFDEADVLGKQYLELGISAVDENSQPVSPENLPADWVLRTHLPIHNSIIGWRRPRSQDLLWIFGNVTPQFDKDGSVIRVISSFADITEMKNAERAIHQLSTQLLHLQDEERRRIGRELHDGLAQTVLAVNLTLAQVRQSIDPLNDTTAHALLKARALLGQMSREIRTLSYLLHPPLLDDLGLVSALKEYVHGFSERSGIETQLYLLSDFGRLPQPVETALFRIVQESLTNIQRHSGSTSAKIRIRRDCSAIILEVIDFGRGMRMPSNGNPQPGDVRLGVGVPGMQERMAQLGGRLDIDSSPAGTTVRATIVLPDGVSKEIIDDTPSHPRRG